MRIRSRGLNSNETFCCSKKDVKNVFSNTNITVNFGKYGRRCNRRYQPQKIKGKIIAALGIINIDARIGMENYGMISFYVLKNEDYNEELRKEFISQVLPKMYDGYALHKDGNPEKVSGTYSFDVELYDGKFIFHEGIET